jgi:hypothetical protein
VTAAEGNAAEPQADTSITLVEMQFEGLPDSATAGDHIWKVTNGGEQLHEMIVQKLSPGVTFDMAHQMLLASGATPAAPASPPAGAMQGPPFIAIGGIAPMSPGHTNYPVLDFQTGDYFAICFVPDVKTGAPHFTMGMIAPFSVA